MSVAARAPAPGRDAGAPSSPGAELAVELRDVAKGYAVRRPLGEVARAPLARVTRTALDGVSLSVAAGTCFGLLGPNGAGKSTLFRILATLVLPDRGEARVHGLDVVDDAGEVRSRIGVVPAEDRSLFWRLTARENVRLYATLHGLRGAARDERVGWALDAANLGDAATVLAGRMSTGMRQRLLLARALVGRPSVLLLDEPTRSLDPVSARDFRRFLREEIVSRQRRTVLLATHAAEEAFGVCDRIAVLDRGRVVAEGSGADLSRAHEEGVMDVWTTVPGHPALDAPGVVRLGPAEPEGDGWTRVRLRVSGGRDGAARLVAALAAGGATVSRVEPVRPSLADMMERLAARGHGDEPPGGREDDHA